MVDRKLLKDMEPIKGEKIRPFIARIYSECNVLFPSPTFIRRFPQFHEVKIDNPPENIEKEIRELEVEYVFLSDDQSSFNYAFSKVSKDANLNSWFFDDKDMASFVRLKYN